MRIYGLELLKGLSITLSHFIASYTVGLRRTFRNRLRGQFRQHPQDEGVFTVQYPDERLKAPERFRVLPVLIYDGKEGEKWTQQSSRCTACGICAKVCPPQCIWIVQARDGTGRAVPKAGEFYIDVDVCMNCGFCAEYCPFDAIKMDHNFELGAQERKAGHIFDINRLHVSTEYYSKTHPKAFAQEEARRQAEAAKKAAAKTVSPAAPPEASPA